MGLHWGQWSKIPNINCWHDSMEHGYSPEAGYIILYVRVFENTEHDHMGIVIEVRNLSIVVAEGNFNIVSTVVNREVSLI